MPDARKKKKIERREIQQTLSEKRKEEDRRSKVLIYGVGAIALVALIAAVSFSMISGQRDKSRVAAAALKPIIGVETLTGFTRHHTSKQVPYSRVPPMGGDHSPEFTNCGIYSYPVNNWRAVHSLEHGAVWITYSPNLPNNQIAILIKQAKTQAYEILSPFLGLPSPIVASAWGKQLKIQNASDPRLPVFLKAYMQGPQTPEVGASCSGGVAG